MAVIKVKTILDVVDIHQSTNYHSALSTTLHT